MRKKEEQVCVNEARHNVLYNRENEEEVDLSNARYALDFLSETACHRLGGKNLNITGVANCFAGETAWIWNELPTIAVAKPPPFLFYAPYSSPSVCGSAAR